MNEKQKLHNIIMEGRRKLTISGVTDVDNFDEKAILLYTCMGELTVRGENLRVNAVSVDSGDMEIEGEIKALLYGDKDRRNPLTFIGRLFR